MGHCPGTFEQIEQRITPDGTPCGNGPLAVSDVSNRIHPVNRYYLAAAQEIGLPATDDFNGNSPEGVGIYQITTRNGLRCSCADAFLRPARKRSNVTVRTNSLVTRVIFDERRAIGVEIRDKTGQRQLTAQREVILSAGAINSPQILQLSGIGPGACSSPVVSRSCTTTSMSAVICKTTSGSITITEPQSRPSTINCRPGGGRSSRDCAIC